MSKEPILFIKRLTVYSTIIVILSFVVSHFISPKFITPVLPYIILFFYLITILLYYLINKTTDKKFSKFVTVFMMAIALKMLLYLAIMLLYIFLINKRDAIPFISAFFIYYLLFTVFETVYIVVSSKDNKYK
jgi:hypothetical protein